MNRKILFPIIIISSFLIGFLFTGLLGEIYKSTGVLETFDGLVKYTAIKTFTMFLSSTVFYMLILIYFKEFMFLRIFSAISIIIAFSFAGYAVLSLYYEFSTLIIRYYAGTTYFLGLVNLVIAVSIILKELHHKVVSLTILYSANITFLFGTLVIDYIRGYIGSFFGLGSNQQYTIYIVFDTSVFLLQLSVVLLQAYSIIKLVYYQEVGKVMYTRKKL